MNLDFEKISVKQVIALIDVLIESTVHEEEHLRQKYLKNAIHFDETLSFMIGLELITISGTHVLLSTRYTDFLKNLSKLQPENRYETVQRFLIENLIHSTPAAFGSVSEFLSCFQLEENRYRFSPDNLQRLKYSGLRNLLIDLSILSLEADKKTYVISDDKFFIYSEVRSKQRLPLDEFLNILKKKGEIGAEAEMEILKYEKQRLSAFPELAEQVEHTLKLDVAAGYDIKSCEIDSGQATSLPFRFIEVKAVSSRDFGFCWTRNEIEVAKTYGQSYYLYLLPVLGKNHFDLSALKIIQNPYLNVFLSPKCWGRTEELISFFQNEKRAF